MTFPRAHITQSIENAIKQWTDEAKDYNAQSPVFSHFTQVVWAGTAQVGCAMQDCPGLLGPVATYGVRICFTLPWASCPSPSCPDPPVCPFA